MSNTQKQHCDETTSSTRLATKVPNNFHSHWIELNWILFLLASVAWASAVLFNSFIYGSCSESTRAQNDNMKWQRYASSMRYLLCWYFWTKILIDLELDFWKGIRLFYRPLAKILVKIVWDNVVATVPHIMGKGLPASKSSCLLFRLILAMTVGIKTMDKNLIGD